MTCSPRLAGCFGVLATVVLSAAAAAPQELASVEQEAFAAVSRTVAALERADGRSALIQTAAQVATAVDHARDAVAAADHTRETAAEEYRAAYRAALAGAVTCDNGYPCTNNRLDRFEGLADALVRHLQLLAGVSFANAAYVEAVGVAGADEARERGSRIRRLAARMRNVDAAEAMDRWNNLIGGVLDDSDATCELQGTATEAHAAARRARFEDVDQVLGAIAAAATREPAPDVALRAVLGAARGSAEALRSNLTEGENASTRASAGAETPASPDRALDEAAAVAKPEVPAGSTADADAWAALDRAFAAEAAAEAEPDEEAAPRPTADADAWAALDRAFAAEAAAEAELDEEAAPRPTADADAWAALDRAFAAEAAAEAELDEEAAPRPVTAAANEAVANVAGEPEPTDLAAWVRAVNAGVRRAEEAAGEAEAAAADTGSWFSRTAACVDARDRLSHAWERVRELTIGEARPAFVTETAGAETYCEVEEWLEAARERGRVACESIGQPR